MAQHFSTDADRSIALKRSRVLVLIILTIVFLLMGYCLWAAIK